MSYFIFTLNMRNCFLWKINVFSKILFLQALQIIVLASLFKHIFRNIFRNYVLNRPYSKFKYNILRQKMNVHYKVAFLVSFVYNNVSKLLQFLAHVYAKSSFRCICINVTIDSVYKVSCKKC